MLHVTALISALHNQIALWESDDFVFGGHITKYDDQLNQAWPCVSVQSSLDWYESVTSRISPYCFLRPRTRSANPLSLTCFYNIYFVSDLYTQFKRRSVNLITTELKWVGVLVALEQGRTLQKVKWRVNTDATLYSRPLTWRLEREWTWFIWFNHTMSCLNFRCCLSCTFSLLCSPSALRPGSCVGHRMWILLAMTHLTLDFSTCSPLSQGLGIKLTPKSVSRSRSSWQPLWDSPNKIHWRTVSPLAHRLQNPFPPTQDNRVGIRPKVKVQKHQKPEGKEQATCKECRLRYPQMETGDPLALIAKAPKAPSSGIRGDTVRLLRRTRRQLKWDSYDKSQEGRTTTVAGFIDWGPTGTDSIDDDGKLEPNITLSTRVSTTTVATTTSTTTRLFQRTFTVVTTPEPKRLSTTRATVGETVKPPKPYGDTPGKIHRLTNNQIMWSSWLIWESKVEKWLF